MNFLYSPLCRPYDDKETIEVPLPQATSKCKFTEGIHATGIVKSNYSFYVLSSLVKLIEKTADKVLQRLHSIGHLYGLHVINVSRISKFSLFQKIEFLSTKLLPISWRYPRKPFTNQTRKFQCRKMLKIYRPWFLRFK